MNMNLYEAVRGEALDHRFVFLAGSPQLAQQLADQLGAVKLSQLAPAVLTEVDIPGVGVSGMASKARRTPVVDGQLHTDEEAESDAF